MRARTIIGIAFLGIWMGVPGWAADPRSLGYDGGGGPGSNSNPHNLSSRSSANLHAPAEGEEQICIFCHTPHGARPQTTLWNRPNLANADSSYPLYGGGLVIKGDYASTPEEIADVISKSEYTNTDAAIEYPNGASRMCMSCHDGVTAVGEVLAGGELAILEMTSLGTIDLSSSHPISFVYDQAVKDAIDAVPVKTGAYKLPTGIDYVPLDSRNRMQCTTCHDPHMDTRDATYLLPFWRHDIADQAVAYDEVCAACHINPATAPGHGLEEPLP